MKWRQLIPVVCPLSVHIDQTVRNSVSVLPTHQTQRWEI